MIYFIQILNEHDEPVDVVTTKVEFIGPSYAASPSDETVLCNITMDSGAVVMSSTPREKILEMIMEQVSFQEKMILDSITAYSSK